MPKVPTDTLPPAPAFDPIGSKNLRPRPPPPDTTTPRNAGSRTNDLLGLDFRAPNFASWASAGPNKYTPFWTPIRNVSAKGTGAFEFSIKPTKVEDKELKYATEHIYEIQLIPAFVKYMDNQIKEYLASPGLNQTMQAFGTSYNKDPSKFWATVFKTKGQDWTNFAPWKAVLPETLFSGCLAGGDPTKDAEFMYLESQVNGLKGTFFSLGVPSVNPAEKLVKGNEDGPAVDILMDIANTKLVADYLADPTVAKVYKDTSARVLARVEELQQALFQAGGKTTFVQLSKLDWPGHYIAFENALLDTIGRNMESVKNRGFPEAIKGLELSLKSNYASGRGETSKAGAPIKALLDIINAPGAQDRLVPNGPFKLAELRQAHNVSMSGNLPAGFKEITGIIPVPPNAAAAVSAAVAATAPATAAPTLGSTGAGAPTTRSLPTRAATALAQTVGPPLAQNLAAPVARSLAPAAVSTLGPPIAKAGAKALVKNLMAPSGSK